jgi:hypothetical protein
VEVYPSVSMRQLWFEHAKRGSCESHTLLCEPITAVFGFLFIYVVLTFELMTYNFRYEDLSLTVS